MSESILLIHPPLSKPCEPPAGLARIVCALEKAGIFPRVFDASLEGLLYLLEKPIEQDDTWSRRATKKVNEHIAALRTNTLYPNSDRYKRAVLDLNRVLSNCGSQAQVKLTLSNYTDPRLSPLRSSDLMTSARMFGQNIFYPFFKNELSEIFSDKEPDIVGFSVNYLSQALCAFAMVGLIKNMLPKVQIIMGGGLITSWMGIPGFKNPFIELVDVLVQGPGEEAIFQICGKPVNSLASYNGFRYHPFPMDKYISPWRVIPYATSRGCYWQKCTFCPEKAEKNRYQPFEISQVINDVNCLVEKNNPCLIHFLDSALTPSFLTDLIRNPPGAPWYGFVRITKHLTDLDFVVGLKRSNCVMLKLGIESGDQKVLDALQKGIDLEVVSAALKTLKTAGIAVYAYLLFGTPAENLDSARKTMGFTLDHAWAIDYLNIAVFNMPAYGEDSKQFETAGFYDGDLSLYCGFKHPQGWSRKMVKKFLAKEFKTQRPIRSILTKDPPFFTSNHAPFFHLF